MSNNTTITYRSNVSARLDMRWITTALSNGYTADETKKLTIEVGNKNVEIGELFDIAGNLSNPNITLENSSSKFDYTGYALPQDVCLTVQGDTGHYSGAQLAGGKLVIHGSSGDYTASTMFDGLIEVKHNTGEYTGSAYSGNKKGMMGGTVLIHGNSGDFTGDLMRRGIIMVVGNIGDFCGSRMIAGTITNLGYVGKHAGAGMRRGTLLFPELPEQMAATFTNCGRHNLGYLTLLVRQLRTYDSEFRSLHSMRRRVQKYLGDVSVGGLGELLIWIG